MFFASDNSSGVPEQVLAALSRANDGFSPAYGADAIMGRVRARIREIFEAPEAAVYLVATGTAANALAIATHCPPWGAVYCHRIAHIEEDECGAPEFYTAGRSLCSWTARAARWTRARLPASSPPRRRSACTTSRRAWSA
jgi:threonine aldolase